MAQAGLADVRVSDYHYGPVEMERLRPDTWVLQRLVSDAPFEMVRRTAPFTQAFKVAELDDYLLNLPMKNGHRGQLPQDMQRVLRRWLDLTDRLVVSTAPLAQAMAKLGVTVKLFNRQAKVGGISDEALNAIAIDVLANNPNTPTLELLLNVKIDGLTLSEDGEQISVDYQDLQGSKQRFSADRVLLAIGRKTHLASLGVQSIDVEIDERGNPKNVNPKTGQVGDSNVYIIGDANAILPLMHVASDEGYNAGSVVCGDGNSDLVFQRVPMAITFTEPNICQVGENLPTLNAMQDKGELQFVTGRVNFSNQGRSRVMGVNMGQMHIYAHKDNGKILGASMIAPDGEYLTHLLALAIDNGLTAKKMLEMPFYHPTIVEALRTCLRDVERQLHIEFIPNEKLTP